VLITDNLNGINTLLDKIWKLASLAKLSFRPNKCGFYSKNNHKIKIDNTLIPNITKTNLYNYLGVPFGDIKKSDIESVISNAKIDRKQF
jgi:hypothetical protein